MIYGFYLIWDERNKEFGSPLILKNDDAAKRVYFTSVSKWPDYEDDFVLYKVGEYNPENLGKPLQLYPSPVRLSDNE